MRPFARRGHRRRAVLLVLTLAASGLAGLLPASAGVVWTTLPSVPQPAGGVTDAASTDGPCPAPQTGTCVYVLGGEDPFGTLTAAVSAYNPATNSWTTVAPMGTARSLLAAVSAPCHASQAAAGATCIYAFGGETAVSDGSSVVQSYQPATNTWITVASMSVGRSDLGAATAPCPGGSGTCVYAIGGRTTGAFHATAEAYNPDTNTWTTVTATLPTGRQALGGTAAPCPLGQSGTCVYAVGGFDLETGVLDAVETYNPVTNTWTATVPMESPRFGQGAETAPCPPGQLGTCVYVVGKPTGADELLRTESYNPITNAWSTLPPTPVDRNRIATASAPCPAGQVGRCVYAAGGRSAGGAVSKVFESLNPGVGSPAPATTADLQVTLAADRTRVRIGRNVTYTVAVKNLGPDAAGATASLALPSRQGFVSVSGATCVTPAPNASGIVQCNLPSLNPGSTTIITVVARGKKVGPATAQASVSVVAPANDPAPANNSATLSVPVTLI